MASDARVDGCVRRFATARRRGWFILAECLIGEKSGDEQRTDDRV